MPPHSFSPSKFHPNSITFRQNPPVPELRTISLQPKRSIVHRELHITSRPYDDFTVLRAFCVISYSASLNANRNAAVMTDWVTLGPIP